MTTRERQWAVGAIIPARNEARTIRACIESVRAALQRSLYVRDAWIVVVCDSCTDDTADVARRALGDCGEVLVCGAASAGTARRLGVQLIKAHFANVPASRLWLANTDADTCVPRDWLTCQLALAQHGWAAIAGIVRIDVMDEGGDVERDFNANYRINADGSHEHVHGANFGVRADAYLQAGGWGDKPLAEDHCLWARLGAQQSPRLSTASVVVTTSGRLMGRASGGFADTLRAQVTRRHG